MTLPGTRWLGRAAGLLAAAAAFVPSPSLAQAAPPGFARSAEDPGAALSRHLVTIAENPRSFAALKGAGEAALALGDPQAALTFLGRAEEIAPRDGRIKGMMGSALLAMEQVRPAIRFFDDATALGVPEAEIAGDRGLAYDLIGNPRLAQRDYQLALRQQDDPEVRRRLALSLAISGDRNGALRTIDNQLRQQDRAAWRARAFILALTGDAQGATNAVRAVMAPPVAAALAPFLARLPSLAPADRAFAVHFGRFPQGALSGASEAAVAPPQSGALAEAVRAGTPDPGQAPLGSPATQAARPAAPAPTKALPGGGTRVTIAQSPIPAPVQAPMQAPVQAGQGPPQTAAAQPSAAAAGPPLPSPEAAPAGLAAAATSITDPVGQPPAGPVSPPQRVEIAAVDLPPASIPTEPAAAAPAEPSKSRLAELAALITALPDTADEAPPTATPVPAQKPAASKPPAAKPQPKKARAPPREPSRIWVQIAGGADKDALPREFARLKAKAPTLFAGKTAWTSTLRATNRLLVGPFKTDGEAQDFVNRLAKAQLAGFSWTSEDGQAVEKLPAR